MKAIINWLRAQFRGEPSVANLVSDMKRQQERLAEAAKQLKDLAAARRAEADELARRIAAHTKDAEWAERVATKYDEFIR
jgi:hypothetical protein